jgi:hypothetical protein
MEQKINLTIPEEQKLGRFVNLVFINHSADMFTVDMVYVQGALSNTHIQEAVTISRSHITPGHAKRLVAALQKNIDGYEERFGKIDPGTPVVILPNAN